MIVNTIVYILSYKCYLFQATDDVIMDEINPNVKADIKVDSEDFCIANDDQTNYDGMRRIIVRPRQRLLPHSG